MEESENHYSIEELAELVDLPIRTIRYYISEGLLPGPGARGKAAVYGEEHLLRLRLIRLLSRQYVPLVEMRNRLLPLSLDEIRALLTEEEAHVTRLEQAAPSPREGYVATLLRKARTERQEPPSPPLPYAPAPGQAGRKKVAEAPPAPLASTPMPVPAAGQWQRWELAPGVELHVRADSEVQQRPLLERLFQAAHKHYPSEQKK
jgi:Ca-activated chloride channel family protein